MDSTEAAKAAAEWAEATCDGLTNAYSHDPSRILDALPIATASASRESVLANDPRLGIEIADFGIEQADLHTMQVEILLLVRPEPADEASAQLESFVSALRLSLAADPTLGGRVMSASRYWDANYEPPFLEFDDGTTARAATFSLAVAELT